MTREVVHADKRFAERSAEPFGMHDPRDNTPDKTGTSRDRDGINMIERHFGVHKCCVDAVSEPQAMRSCGNLWHNAAERRV